MTRWRGDCKRGSLPGEGPFAGEMPRDGMGCESWKGCPHEMGHGSLEGYLTVELVSRQCVLLLDRIAALADAFTCSSNASNPRAKKWSVDSTQWSCFGAANRSYIASSSARGPY